MTDNSAASQQQQDAADEVFDPLIVCGLLNLGNTCYFNAGLQLLMNVRPFVTWLNFGTPMPSPDTEERHSLLHPTHSSARRRLLSILTSTVSDMRSGERLQIAPRDLLSQFAELNAAFQGMHQQDCPEMLAMLLGQLEDETKWDVHRQSVLDEVRGVCESSPSLCPSSKRYVKMLDLLSELDRENAEAERKERAAKRATASPSTPIRLDSALEPDTYRPPHITRNAVTDCFRGQMLHEITCLNCGHVSRTSDEFTSLTVELPTHKQRAAYHMRHPDRLRYDATGAILNPHAAPTSQSPSPSQGHKSHDPVTPKAPNANSQPPQPPLAASSKKATGYRWWNPLRYVAAFMSVMSSCIFGRDPVSHALTLEECLDVHFHEETLCGANRYLCPNCLKPSMAKKRHSILWFPEYVLIHMKRFEMGAYWTSKRSEPMIFPMGSDSPTSSMRRPLELGAYGAEALKHAPSVSSYRLVGVVNHHGGYSGGHYTAYTKKRNIGWVLCNDGAVAGVREETVAESEEYVLLYEKAECGADTMRLQSEHMASVSLAKRAQELLERDSERQSHNGAHAARCPADFVMVSRAWLHRAATFQEPAPLLNRFCYCRAAVSTTPHAHGSALGSFVPIPRSDYDAFVRTFGGPEAPLLAPAFNARVAEEETLLRTNASR